MLRLRWRASANPICMLLRELWDHVVGRVVGFDAGVQRIVDWGAFALQRRGVARSSQLAALHLVMCGSSAAVAPEMFRESAPLGFLVVAAALVWFVMGAFVYSRERFREQVVGGPHAKPSPWAGSRVIAWWLVFAEVRRWPEDVDALHFFASIAFVVLAYLWGTPRTPPPQKRKAPALVTVRA